MKYKLFLLPSPPPYAGPEIIAQNLLNSDTIKLRKDIIYINSSIRKSNAAKGKLDFKGIIIFIRIYTKFIINLFRSNIVFIYLSSSRIGFLRDGLYIIACWIFKKKCIAQYHGANFHNFYYSQNQYYQKWIKFSLSKLKTLLVLEESIRKKFNNIYFKDIRILNNGLKTNDYGPKQKYFSNVFTVFFMGHLIYSKGFYDLVDAYKLLYKKYGNILRFIFAGENVGFKRGTAIFLNGKWKDDFLQTGKSKNSEIQNFIENSKKWNSKYLGFISDKEKLRTFRKSDLFVLPSYTEGFSMACLEAMAVGLPVITTPVGAMPEVVKHNENGLITEIGNPRKLAEDIEYFINNRGEIERIGKNNSLYVRNNFDIEIIAQKLLGILEN